MRFDFWFKAFLGISTVFSVIITGLIAVSVISETARFFEHVPAAGFFFGTHWSPQMAIRADQAGSSGAFGILPVLTGTLLIALIAMCVAVPLGLFSAIYLSVYASAAVRNRFKPVLEILAGVPTVVYGYFAVLAFSPMLRGIGEALHISIASESALVAGVVMGMMITPFIMSLSEDVMSAVPKALVFGSLAMGATPSETVCRVVIPAALPGIAGAVLLGFSRGIGETMIVVMAAGLSANLTFNPLSAVTTATVQMVTLLVGDHEFDSPKTLAAFALGFTLFVMTLVLNAVAQSFVRKHKKRYA